MYRFRSISSLLGKYQELQNQEIYFSDIESLNDPMEGFREIFWYGDKIVWENLFKHYLLCLENICVLGYLSNEETFKQDDIPIFLDPGKLPTDEYKKMFQEICDRFFQHEGINEYLDFLADSPIKTSRDELYVHLKNIHLLAFLTISEVHAKHKYIPEFNSSYLNSNNIKQIIDSLGNIDCDDEKGQEEIKILLNIQKDIMEEIDLMVVCNLENTPTNQRKWFILNEFPNAYLNEVVKLSYPEGYVACFMDDWTSPVVWGHYADGHKGACLKFKVKDTKGSPSIDLYCTTGWGSSGPMYGYRTFSFRKINYSNQFQPIDFFKSIGSIPINQLLNQWYTDKYGNLSKCAKHMKDEESIQDWRKEYWSNYDSSFFMKLKEWEYEKEQRLFLSSSLEMYNTQESRKLKYKFEDLEAIIFGMRTSVEDKAKIIKIIKAKCKENNRKDFDFYQAFYSSFSGKMEIKKLCFIKQEILNQED
jgi:hypothetical protein